MDNIRQSLIQGAAMALLCFTDGQTSLERVFMSELRRMSEGVNPIIQQWTVTTSMDHFRSLTSSIELERMRPLVEPMIMDVEAGRSWTAVWNAEIQELMERNSATPAEATAPSAANEAEPMMVDEDVPEAVAAAATADVVSESPGTRTGRESRLERLRQEATRRSSQSKDQEPPETAIDVVLGSQPWHNDVPHVINSPTFTR